MNTKLTLTIEKAVITKAKAYARQKGQSLSEMVENYLNVVTQPSETHPEELTPVTRALKGSFHAPKGFKY